MTPVRDDAATITCPVCGACFVPQGRQRCCTTTCRQKAWRRRRAAPVVPATVAKSATVYECGSCGNRFLGTQRCEECNTWARRVGPGGSCPSCDEPVAISDFFSGIN